MPEPQVDAPAGSDAERVARPLVRVVDASLHVADGPVDVVLSSLGASVERLGTALLAAGARAVPGDRRVRVVAPVRRISDAAGRVGGADLAVAVDRALERAVRSWTNPPVRPQLDGVPAGVPVVMGIVNVTPDSFSDGGDHATTDAAVAHGLALRDEGAHLLDVGGESTRPGAEPVGEDEELARVVPVVEGLVAEGCVVSIDTTKAAVASACVAAGAAVVNDISAGRLDPDLLPTVARLRVPYVAMHMQGVPRTMQAAPAYDDVVAEVHEQLAGVVRRMEDLGVAREDLWVDPGIGFGKRLADNLALLRDLRQLRSLGLPVLVGASRKRFLGELTGVAAPSERLFGSVAAAALAVAAGATIVRVHDVAATVEAVAVADAIGGVPSDPSPSVGRTGPASARE